MNFALIKALPWHAIGAAAVLAVIVALTLRGNHYESNLREAVRENGRWIAITERTLEIANENAAAAQAAQNQAAEAEAVAATYRRQRDGATARYDDLKAKVRHDGTGDPLQPGVRAAIGGLPE